MAVDEMVDWLELTALFDAYGVPRLDSLDGALDQLLPEPEDDIGYRDHLKEERRSDIENEIDARANQLGEAYPFRLSDEGEELSVNGSSTDEGNLFYLVCLITSHVTDSAILRVPPQGELLTRLRNRVFQILATLGLAGLAGGPALSVGWP